MVDEVLQLLAARGAAQYGGEPITQLAHALQTAALAEAENAGAALITAALLHDIGHLADPRPDADRPHRDHRHEATGARHLRRWFAPEVTAPIALHVAAKRWLCATDATYRSGLSAASVLSLDLQGGVMAADEAARFLSRPHAADAVRLRRWDDAAKVPGLPTPDLAHFAVFVRAAAVR